MMNTSVVPFCGGVSCAGSLPLTSVPVVSFHSPHPRSLVIMSERKKWNASVPGILGPNTICLPG